MHRARESSLRGEGMDLLSCGLAMVDAALSARAIPCMTKPQRTSQSSLTARSALSPPGTSSASTFTDGSTFEPDGHVLVVDTTGPVTGRLCADLLSQNSGDSSNATVRITATLSNGTLTIPNSGAWSYPVIGVVHAPGTTGGGSSPPTVTAFAASSQLLDAAGGSVTLTARDIKRDGIHVLVVSNPEVSGLGTISSSSGKRLRYSATSSRDGGVASNADLHGHRRGPRRVSDDDDIPFAEPGRRASDEDFVGDQRRLLP